LGTPVAMVMLTGWSGGMLGMALAAAEAAPEVEADVAADAGAAEGLTDAGPEADGAMLAAAEPPQAASAPPASSPNPASSRKCLRLTDAFTTNMAFPPCRSSRSSC